MKARQSIFFGMDALRPLSILLRTVFQVLRCFKVSLSQEMSEADAAGLAWGLAYAALATAWQRRKRIPSWPAIYADWQKASPENAVVDERLYGRFHPADQFHLLTDNRGAFDVRFALFESAQSSIDISTYYIQSDDLGWRTAHKLADCARRGVRVRVIADSVVTRRKAFECPRVTHLIQFLKDAGVDYRLFIDSARPYDANHRKLLIIDRTTLITGGRNYADHYAGAEWRDIDLRLTGPSVAQIQRHFDETFHIQSSLAGNRGHADIFKSDTPADISSNAAFTYLLQCIRCCQHTLDIEHAYLFSHPILQSHLREACQRGVKVRLFTNSAESNDLAFANYRLYLGLRQFFDAGSSIYLRRGAGLTLHCKYFVADGEWVGFGSSNLDYYSPRFCHELAIQVRDRNLGAALTEWFELGIAQADHLTSRGSTNLTGSWSKVGKIFDLWFPDIQ